MKRQTDLIAFKKLMIEKGLEKIADLSAASGVDRTILGRILNGKVQPSADAMYKLADALCMTPEQAGSIFFSA